VKRGIQKKVLNELSKQMLLGKVQPKTKVILDVFDGQCLSRAGRSGWCSGRRGWRKRLF